MANRPENVEKKGLSSAGKYVILSGAWLSMLSSGMNALKEGFNVKSGNGLKGDAVSGKGKSGREEAEPEEGFVFRSF